MFRHVVLFSWKPEMTEEHKRALAGELGKLPSEIAELRAYHFGPDAGLRPGNFDFAVVADFDDRDGYAVYRDHPAHRAIVDRHVTPMAAQRAAVQYEC
jgi:Stress responsive A/B Barrel Domain